MTERSRSAPLTPASFPVPADACQFPPAFSPPRAEGCLSQSEGEGGAVSAVCARGRGSRLSLELPVMHRHRARVLRYQVRAKREETLYAWFISRRASARQPPCKAPVLRTGVRSRGPFAFARLVSPTHHTAKLTPRTLGLSRECALGLAADMVAKWQRDPGARARQEH